MIYAILITDFKLRGAFHAQFFFIFIKFIEFSKAMRTFTITALVDRYFRRLLPEKESMITIGAVIFGFIFFKLWFDWKGIKANFAFEL